MHNNVVLSFMHYKDDKQRASAESMQNEESQSGDAGGSEFSDEILAAKLQV